MKDCKSRSPFCLIKRNSYLLIVLVLCCLFTVYGRDKAYAVDISVGATTWYAWWDWENTAAGARDPDVDPILFFGPVLSVKLNEDFNLTAVFLYGQTDAKFPDERDVKIKRSDFDLALNYKLNNYFKVFGGLKYLDYTYSFKSFWVTNDYFIPAVKFEEYGLGPGLGLSCTYPINDHLFLLGTFSGFYLWGEMENSGIRKENTEIYGINSTLSIAYYIAQASTAISLGGRFQYFISDDNIKGKKEDKFYGITLTATYSVSL